MAPLVLYFFNFQYRLSNDASDWAAFGSYVGGIYGALAFFAVASSIYITRSQFVTQSEDDVFYRSVESLNSKAPMRTGGFDNDFEGESFAKSFVVAIQEELERQSPHMARKVLCNNPGLISQTNMWKIINSVNSAIKTSENRIEEYEFLEEVGKRQGFESKWEYLKCVLGGIDNEYPEVKSSLMDAGSVSFYRTDFDHRKYYYDLAWQDAAHKYSEEVNVYLRKFDFILCHVVGSKRKLKYKKFLLSQISKYDIVLLYSYALTIYDPNFLNLVLKVGLLDEVQRDECRFILFDCPSSDQVAAEISSISNRVNKSLKS